MCPHCGHAQPRKRFIDQPVDREAAPEESSPGPLSPSTLSDESMRADDPNADSASQTSQSGGEPLDDDAVELPLEEVMSMGTGKTSKGKKARGVKPRPNPSASSSGTGRPERRRVERRGAGGRRSGDRTPGETAPAGALPMDADQLRHLIGEHPELLEPGLRVLGEEGRRQLGIGYGTEVGEIDLLARTESGDWVVVMVAAGSPGPQVVSDVLHRVGWVRKHLCEEDESVRAILLLDRVDDELGYAAAAVADTVSFKTWKVSIRFDSVDV